MVMMNYASEYSEYCDACQSAETVIMSSDAAVKSCIERLIQISDKRNFIKWPVLKASKGHLL